MKRWVVITFLSAVAAVGCGNGNGNGDGGSQSCAPKTGYETAVALGAAGKGDYGHSAMVLDGSGQPMLAFVAYDPNGDGDASDTTVDFVSYDRATCTWNAPIVVDVSNDVDSTREREVTLTRDPANGQLGIGYMIIDPDNANLNKVMLAQSGDNGVTWTKEMVAQGTDSPDEHDVSRPTVAMKDGETYFVYYRTWDLSSSASNGSDANAFHLLARSGTSGAFNDTIVPGVGDGTLPGASNGPPALAIDADGHAALAFIANTDDDSYTRRVTYYKAGAAHSVGVFDSLDAQNDGWGVSLAFEGDKPRIAAALQRGDTDSDNSMIWFSKSDDGTTWTAPVELPLDGSNGMGEDLSIAANGKGELSIATRMGSSGGDDSTCGAPKLATSNDDGKTWATCGPALAPDTQAFFAGDDVMMAYAPNGKRVMGWFDTASDDPYSGIVVWREP